MHRLEAALDGALQNRRESSNRPGDALEFLWPEVLPLEKIAEEPARGLSDNDHVGLGNGLKACCEVRRFANNIMLLRFA